MPSLLLHRLVSLCLFSFLLFAHFVPDSPNSAESERQRPRQYCDHHRSRPSRSRALRSHKLPHRGRRRFPAFLRSVRIPFSCLNPPSLPSSSSVSALRFSFFFIHIICIFRYFVYWFTLRFRENWNTDPKQVFLPLIGTRGYCLDLDADDVPLDNRWCEIIKGKKRAREIEEDIKPNEMVIYSKRPTFGDLFRVPSLISLNVSIS